MCIRSQLALPVATNTGCQLTSLSTADLLLLPSRQMQVRGGIAYLRLVSDTAPRQERRQYGLWHRADGALRLRASEQHGLREVGAPKWVTNV